MSTAELDPISRACRLLREGAAELKNCHTLAATGHDWTGEPEAKAAYDEHMATADALERWADSIGAGGVESLRGRQCLHRISEPAGEYPALPDAAGVVVEHVPVGGGWVRHERRQSYTADQMRAYVDADRAMRAAQPAGAILGEQAELRRLSDCCPELNLSNYGHDDVDELNGWAIEVSQCIDRALAAQPAGAQQPTTKTAPQQEAASVDLKTMELAESVGLIGPASRTNDLHAAIQRFHDLICANATIKAAAMAVEVISGVSAHQWDTGYPPLPKPNIQRGGFPNLFTEDQMRAYVDADRAAQEGKSHGTA